MFATKNAFLKPCFLPQMVSVAGKKTQLMSQTDGIFRMGKLKRKYLTKAPIITFNEDRTVKVEGIKDKTYPLAVSWKMPEYIFRGNPGEDASGDMAIYPEPDLSRPRKGFAGLKAYEEAPEEVKRLLSLEMGRRRDLKAVVREDFRMMVAEHKHDFRSNVVKITYLTLAIRNVQKYLALLAKDGWRDSAAKHRLKRMVDQRRAQLGHLRKEDYPKFEWLLEKLDLVYKPRPFVYQRIIRKRETDKLVNLLCDETRTFKMQQLKDALEEDQPEFLKKKIQTLTQIMEDEKKNGLKQTVTNTDLEKAKERLKEVEENLAKREKRVINYHIFEEQIEQDEHTVR